MAYSETNTKKKKSGPAGPQVTDGRLRVMEQQNFINTSKADTAKKNNIPQMSPEDVTSQAEALYKKWLASQSSGRGKGGGGGPNALDRYTRQLQSMLTSGSYAKPYGDLETKLNEMYGQAQPKINEAMTNLQTTLRGMQNPYENFQAQTTQVTPELSQLLQSQGVNANPLQEMAALTQAQNAGQSTAFGNLANTLKGLYGANQAGMVQDAATQQADLTNALEQSRLGFGAQIANQRMDSQNALIKQLLDAIAKGGRPNAGRMF